jgi:hypothetical protein
MAKPKKSLLSKASRLLRRSKSKNVRSVAGRVLSEGRRKRR